ncbi:putative membrane associated protein, partial [Trypanosoma theileri]
MDSTDGIEKLLMMEMEQEVQRTKPKQENNFAIGSTLPPPVEITPIDDHAQKEEEAIRAEIERRLREKQEERSKGEDILSFLASSEEPQFRNYHTDPQHPEFLADADQQNNHHHEAEERAREEALQRQREAEERAREEALQRQREAEERAREEALQRQREAEERAREEALQRQREAEERAREEALQ